MFHELRRDWQSARELAEAATALSVRQGFSLFWIMATLVLGGALSEQGDGDRGRSMIAESAKAAAAAGARLLRSYGLGLLARACAKAGRLDEACAVLNDALACVAPTGERLYEAELHRLHGEFLLQRQTPACGSRAEACFRRAIDIATEQRAVSWRLRALVSLARLHTKLGKRPASVSTLGEVYGSFTEGLETADLRDAAALLSSEAV